MNSDHKSLILHELQSLEGMGFKLVSGADIDRPDKLVYENANMRIAVDYDVFVDNSYFGIFISSIDFKAGYRWEDFLNSRKIPSTTKRSDESDSDFIRRFLAGFKGYLQGDLRPVVHGERWTHVPVDYKHV